VVGIIIGLILAGLNLLLTLFLPVPVVNGLLLVALVALNGALHLDGFVDTCDGLAGHGTVEERWRAMHDSRAGAFGIVGVFLLLIVKYVSLNSVPDGFMTATLVLMPLVGRWAMVYALFAFPYARAEGLGKVFKQGANWQRFTLATVITLAAVICLAWLAGFTYFYLAASVIMIGIWIVAGAVAAWFRRKFSGLNGDTYGAINEITEVCLLILVCLLTYNQWFV